MEIGVVICGAAARVCVGDDTTPTTPTLTTPTPYHILHLLLITSSDVASEASNFWTKQPTTSNATAHDRRAWEQSMTAQHKTEETLDLAPLSRRCRCLRATASSSSSCPCPCCCCCCCCLALALASALRDLSAFATLCQRACVRERETALGGGRDRKMEFGEASKRQQEGGGRRRKPAHQRPFDPKGCG